MKLGAAVHRGGDGGKPVVRVEGRAGGDVPGADAQAGWRRVQSCTIEGVVGNQVGTGRRRKEKRGKEGGDGSFGMGIT